MILAVDEIVGNDFCEVKQIYPRKVTKIVTNLTTYAAFFADFWALRFKIERK